MPSTAETLTLIWQRVLQRPSIGSAESFFDLGGTDEQALLLLSEIAQVFGRLLPTSTLRQVPTITSLAAFLEGSIISIRSSPFIQIKTGSQKPPIFITHGLCGTARFSGLAKHIRTGHSIYGIQGKGIDGMEEPFERVEDMAEFYLEALENLCPQGPYILIGYSFGGLVALEMAQRLSETERKIALLVLLDAYPHPSYYAWPERMRLSVTRVKGHLNVMRQLPFTSAFSYFLSGLKRRLQIAGASEESKDSAEILSLPFGESALRRVKEKAYLAYESYRPSFYRGKIHFITTQTKSFFPEDPAAVWGPLVADLQVEVIRGSHLNIVTTEFKDLAAVLTRYIEEVTCEHEDDCVQAQ
jgi:thioesterase domain-containing protein